MQMKDLVSKLRYFAIALSVIMVISACGSDDESSDQDNGAPQRHRVVANSGISVQ